MLYVVVVGTGSGRALAVGITLAVAAVAGPGASSAAAYANCPYITASKLAQATRQRHGDAYYDVGPKTFEGTAYQFSICRAFGWTGKIPATRKESYAKIKAGLAASVTIKTEEEVGGSPEAVASWREEYEDETSAYHSAIFAIAKAFHGSIIFPPRHGAEGTFGALTVHKGVGEATAIWYSDVDFDYIEITVSEAKRDHPRRALERLANTAVPGFGV